MKKILVLLLVTTLFAACAKKQVANIPVKEVMEKIKVEAQFSETSEDDLKKMDIAERYGLSIEDIEEGTVFYTKSAEIPDKVVLVKGKDEDAAANIERGLRSEVIGLNDSWGKNEKEYKKVRNHVLKTAGNYVVLIVGDRYKEMEEAFDNALE